MKENLLYKLLEIIIRLKKSINNGKTYIKDT